MTEDFVSRLQVQLRDAAEREAQRGPLSRGLRGTGRRLWSPQVAAALAAAALALAVAAGVLALRGEEEPPPSGPSVVATLELTPSPGPVIAAFGSVWISDAFAGDVVRVDPETRRVLARIRVGTGPLILPTAVGDELWVTIESSPQVTRIDPATDEIVGRFDLTTPDGGAFSPGALVASDRTVWVVSQEGALRLDPATGRGLRLTATATGAAQAVFFALDDRALWENRSDGAIVRYDPRTGAELGSVRPEIPNAGAFASIGDDLIGGDGGRLTRFDGETGRLRWEQPTPGQANAFDFGDGLLWVHSTQPGVGDWLTAYALDDGERISSTRLDTFGASALAVVGDEVWIDSATRTIVVRR